MKTTAGKSKAAARHSNVGAVGASTGNFGYGNSDMQSLSKVVSNSSQQRQLPKAVQTKMQQSFHADFSNVKFFENSMLNGMGANAVARGTEVHFAKGQFNPNSTAGQSLIGHELSHVVSQAKGEVKGNGFVNNKGLEHRADAEGARAAKGQSASGQVAPKSAPVTGNTFK